MLKATLIATAALTALDAVVWHGEYRMIVVQSFVTFVNVVASLDWSGTLTG